jgi:hypothetical protein
MKRRQSLHCHPASVEVMCLLSKSKECWAGIRAFFCDLSKQIFFLREIVLIVEPREKVRRRWNLLRTDRRRNCQRQRQREPKRAKNHNRDYPPRAVIRASGPKNGVSATADSCAVSEQCRLALNRQCTSRPRKRILKLSRVCFPQRSKSPPTWSPSRANQATSWQCI